jgi:acyl-ACP thioesterase
MLQKYSGDYRIPSSDTDINSTLRPSAFLNLAQEAANINAQDMGFGYDELREANTAWILSRVHVIFHKLPKWRDQINIQSWHKGQKSLFYLRDFIVTNPEGEKLISSTTSWLVLNLETRRLVRDSELMEDGTVNPEHVIETPADKVQMPKDIEPVLALEHVVAYSDVDMNAHANNAMYMQWAMDAVEYELASSRPVKELTINFNHETKAGDRVMIYRAVVEKEDGIHVFVEGKVEDVSSFTVELIF